MMNLNAWKDEFILLRPNWCSIGSSSSWITPSLSPNLWVILTLLTLALILTLALNWHWGGFKYVILQNV